jgi:hypothetical protein
MFPPSMSEISITGPYPELGHSCHGRQVMVRSILRFAAVACKHRATEERQNISLIPSGWISFGRRVWGLTRRHFSQRSSKSRTNRRDFSALIGAVRSADERFPAQFLHSAPNSRCARRIRLFQTRASRSNECHFSQSRTIRDRSSVAP